MTNENQTVLLLHTLFTNIVDEFYAGNNIRLTDISLYNVQKHLGLDDKQVNQHLKS